MKLFYYICRELSIDVDFLFYICYNRFEGGDAKMKKYNLIYAKHTFLMCFVISLIAAIPLFIVSLFYDEVEKDKGMVQKK